VESFSFQSKIEITKEMYIENLRDTILRRNDKTLKNSRKIGKVLFFIILILIPLVWKYTISISVFWALFYVFGIFMTKYIKSEKWILKFSPDSWKASLIHHVPLLYGFNENGLTMKSNDIAISVSWNIIESYYENEEWIRIHVFGIIPFYYSINEMKYTTSYNYLKAKLNEIGKKNRLEFVAKN
jgi:hypothetical protein